MQKLKEIWANLRASLWFIPMVMFSGALVLAGGFLYIDIMVDVEWLRTLTPIFAISSDGTRAMLLAVAGSMLTVVALCFTLTLSAMTYASGQFTPRILRNFMSDKANQFVLGYFVGIFAYSLMASLSIRSEEAVQFIPVITAFGGLIFTLGGVIVLIYFIHHIAASLQITTIISGIADDTKASIQELFPANLSDPVAEQKKGKARKRHGQKNWIPIPNAQAGYIQFVEVEDLIEVAVAHDIIIRMEHSVGSFVPTYAPLVSVSSDMYHADLKPSVDAALEHAINSQFILDRHRIIEQDTLFGIRQMVDIALKALSPGINDTSTGVNCIEYLEDVMGELARRDFPTLLRSYEEVPRLIVNAPGFDDYVESAFEQIRISAEANIAIFESLIDAVIHVMRCTDDPSRRLVLRTKLKQIEDFGYATLKTDHEKAVLRRHLYEARNRLA